MPISRDAYQTLADIVGPENISDDPVLCDSYAFQWLAEVVRPDQSHFMPRPAAVMMPGSTEEIQAIVKTCNLYKIKIKPHSTGWYCFGAPQKDKDDTIQLDLRRMNKILDIDEKNMFAVVEPYVICATLQAEVMKLGLIVNVGGAGASSSLLASSTSYVGTSEMANWAGCNSENLLGLEWVMPNGDVLRTGSLGYGAGWFCGEGPGPSLRGICRGAIGARGAMGVYTKCALKLSHWAGPPQLAVKGTTPAYRASIPDNFRMYSLAFPSWPAYADALYKIYDNEIGYILARAYNVMGEDLGLAFWFMYNDPTKTICDIEEIVKKPEVQKLTEEMRRSLQLVLMGRTQRDIEYQDQVLDQILAETGGWKVARMYEPDFAEFTYLFQQVAGQRNMLFAYVGGWLGSWCQKGTPDYMIRYQPVIYETGNRSQKSGLLVQSGSDTSVGAASGLGGGGITGFEQMNYYDPAEKESVKALIKHIEDESREAIKKGFSPGKETWYLALKKTDEELYQQYARSNQPISFRLQGKIKQLIDPNDIGDSLYSCLPEPRTT